LSASPDIGWSQNLHGLVVFTLPQDSLRGDASMKKLFTSCSLLVLVLAVSAVALADIARPKPAPQNAGKVALHTGLEIAVDPNASEARLQIRESDFKSLQASINGGAGNGSVAASVTANPTRTVIAGILLFLSLSFAGVWIARSRRSGTTLSRGQKTFAIALLCMYVVGAAAIVTRGNAGPPPYYRWRNLAENLKKGESTIGSVNVEIVPDSADSGSGMKLIIPIKK
jgi:hypothetical protein